MFDGIPMACSFVTRPELPLSLPLLSSMLHDDEQRVDEFFFFSLFNQRTPNESPREFRDAHGFVDIVLAATAIETGRGEARRGERLYRWQYRCRVKTILGATRCFHIVSHRRYQMLAVNWENISRTQRVGAWKLVNELNRDQGKKYTRFDCSLKCPRSSSRPLYSTLLLFPSPPFRIVRVQPSRMIKILLAEFLYRVFPSFLLSFLLSSRLPRFSSLPIRACVRIN